MDVSERLQGLYLFKNWGPADMAALDRMGRIVERAKGDLLFLQEDPCGHLYILLQGSVQMFRSLPDGREVTIHLLGAGALVACAALFLDASFPASARILSSTAELACLEGGALLRLLESRPDLSRKLIGSLAMRIGQLAERIESRAADSAPVRLVNWLLEQPSTAGEGAERIVRIPGSKKTVAADLGITPETFSRCLKRLAQEGLLAVHGREIRLPDPARLLRHADGE